MNTAQYNALIENSRSFDVKRVVLKYLFHWPLFLIGILCCVAAGFVYFKITKPVYVIKASLIINNDKKDPDQKSALQEIDLINTNKSIENEVEILKSNQLIKKVVQDLQLWVVFQKKDKLLSTELYKNAPFKFTLLEPTGNYNKAGVNVIVKDDQSFYIQDAAGQRKEFSFNTPLKSSFGTWALTPEKDLLKYKGSNIKISIADPENTASVYQKAIDASFPNKLTSTVVLSIEDRIAERGKDILNQVIYEYNLYGSTERNRETEKMLKFIDKRIDSLAGGVTAAEQGIEGFKSSRGLTDLSSDSKISLENMQANSNKLNDVNVQLNIIDGIDKNINSAQGIERSAITPGIADVTLTDLLKRLSDLQLQKDRLLATTPETNPDFDPINRQIATIRSSIKEHVKNIKTSLVSTKEKLQSFDNKFQSSIKVIPTQEREYGSIKRQQSIKENLYTYLLQKREELSVKYASELANDHLVDKAYIETFKGPQASMTFAVALVLGLILPTGLIYTRNSLNDRINDLQEIKKTLSGVPVISQLDYEPVKSDLILNDGETTALSEQFRSLRANLNYYLNFKPGGVTLVTSSISGEGKSFISKNLSVAMTYSGKKTIVLELDLRKPQISELFNLDKSHVGISEFLNNRASLEAIIQPSRLIPDLHVIGSGATVPNPSELLERKELSELINKLKGMYDCIIIDSAPIHLVPDARGLSRLSDLTLYVIRQGFTQLAELDFIKELHEQKQLLNIHLVFNGIERIKYGYGYNYNNNNYYANSGKKSFLYTYFHDFFSRF